MKNFFKSYNDEILKPSIKWMTKHWKGIIVFYLVYYAIMMLIFCQSYIKNSIKQLFKTKHTRETINEEEWA